MSYVAASIAAGAGALGKGITGLLQRRRAKQIEKSNPFVIEQANPLFAKNAAIAENMARVGTPQQQYNNQFNAIQRNQAGALSLLGRRGGSTGSLASIVRAGNDNMGSLNAKDSMDRQNNQRLAFGHRINLAQEQNRVWDWNKRQRFLQKLSESQALRGSGNQNLMGAFDDLSRFGTAMAGMDKPKK